MKKILFLIPPSEGNTSGGELGNETLSFHFEKPEKLVKLASEKDLKCKGKRFEEAQELNNSICSPPLLQRRGDSEVRAAISRYNGVMYSTIDYDAMGLDAKNIFDAHFLICSGMYGLVRPQDTIANYKLPIETKGLSHFWKEKIT